MSSTIVETIMSTKTGVALTAVGVVMLIRSIKRSLSPTIKLKLRCRCGKIHGEINTKVEDTLRLHCYCKDCQNYAKCIAKLGGSSNKDVLKSHGETEIIQVCKSAITINNQDGGIEHLKLCQQKAGMPAGNKRGMFRYYASCCNVPIMNTWDILGFVGIIEDNIDDDTRLLDKKFTIGPYSYATDEAINKPIDNVKPGLPVHRILWNLIRYLPWRHAGPFDFTAEPTMYWGSNIDENNNNKKDK